MANYYVKRTDRDLSNVVYAGPAGTWVAATADAFVTTDSAVGDSVAAMMNLLMQTISAFVPSANTLYPYLITKITA